MSFSGPAGSLSVFAVYLSPDSSLERDRQIKQRFKKYDAKHHNLVLGDFNFVLQGADRICKKQASCKADTADESNSSTWNELANANQLKEFVQGSYSYENSFGWSRIDRASTNMHVADVQAIGSSCWVPDHPRHLTDHKRLAICLCWRSSSTEGRPIPKWVVSHGDFFAELKDEYDFRCKEQGHSEGFPLKPFQKLHIFK